MMCKVCKGVPRRLQRKPHSDKGLPEAEHGIQSTVDVAESPSTLLYDLSLSRLACDKVEGSKDRADLRP